MRLLVFFLLSLVITANTHAETLKVVYHINEIEKTQTLMNSIGAILEAKKETEIKVVFQGSAIVRLGVDSDMKATIKSFIQRGVSFGACSISLINKSLSPSLLIEGVEIINDGGVIRILQLQKQGYGYIKI